jgi:hypothetical protein
MSDRTKADQQRRETEERTQRQREEHDRQEAQRQQEEQRSQRGQQQQPETPAHLENPGAALQTGAPPSSPAEHPGRATGMQTGPNLDPAASPASANHPANPGAALQGGPQPTAEQTIKGLMQRAENAGGGEGASQELFNGLADEYDRLLNRGDVYAAQDLTRQLRSQGPDIARLLKPR